MCGPIFKNLPVAHLARGFVLKELEETFAIFYKMAEDSRRAKKGSELTYKLHILLLSYDKRCYMENKSCDNSSALV